jgi:hypothetical protein
MDRLEVYRSAIEQVLTRHQDLDDTAVRSDSFDEDDLKAINLGEWA